MQSMQTFQWPEGMSQITGFTGLDSVRNKTSPSDID